MCSSVGYGYDYLFSLKPCTGYCGFYFAQLDFVLLWCVPYKHANSAGKVVDILLYVLRKIRRSQWAVYVRTKLLRIILLVFALGIMLSIWKKVFGPGTDRGNWK